MARVSRYRFRDPPSRFAWDVAPSSHHVAPRGFPRAALHQPSSSSRAASTKFRRLQSIPTLRPSRGFMCMLRDASREVSGSFSTTQPVESTHAGLPHPLRSVSRVSRPPDGLLLVRPPGHVSGRSAHGVPTLQSVLHPPEQPRLSARRCLPALRRRAACGRRSSRILCRSSRSRHPRLARALAELQGVAPGWVSVPPGRPVKIALGSWLSWDSAPLQGPPFRPAPRVLPPRLLPRAYRCPRARPVDLAAQRSGGTNTGGSSEYSQARNRPRCSKHPGTPSWGSSTSSTSLTTQPVRRPGS